MRSIDFCDPMIAQEWSQFRDHGDPLSDLAGLNLQASDVVLDLGCGDGWHAIAAAAHVKQVIGIDYSGALLRIARAHAEQAGVKNVLWVHVDLETAGAFIKYTQPTKIICWAVWRGLSDGARVAILQGIAQTSALIVVSDLMMVTGQIQDLDGFLAALSVSGPRWAELVRSCYASGEVTVPDDLTHQFADIGFVCVKKIQDEYGIFWQMFFEKV